MLRGLFRLNWSQPAVAGFRPWLRDPQNSDIGHPDFPRIPGIALKPTVSGNRHGVDPWSRHGTLQLMVAVSHRSSRSAADAGYRLAGCLLVTGSVESSPRSQPRQGESLPVPEREVGCNGLLCHSDPLSSAPWLPIVPRGQCIQGLSQPCGHDSR